mmetsp:Transcript_146218/g.379945  ORF Transcript_146218/g.379945 Transcript_146218/m.379945 type:complete len:250 (-) Transcript_146218:566-1315(-)
MQHACVSQKPWHSLNNKASKDNDQLSENMVICPKTMTPLSTPHNPPAMRRTRGRNTCSQSKMMACQIDRAERELQKTRTQESCQEAASSPAEGYICSCSSSSRRQRWMSPFHLHAARRASKPACFNERCKSPRVSRCGTPPPPRGKPPQPWVPRLAPLDLWAPLVSSQWSCSHSSNVCCRMPKAFSSEASHMCAFLQATSLRASLMYSCNSYCVLNLASSSATALQYEVANCSLGFARHQRCRGTATSP